MYVAINIEIGLFEELSYTKEVLSWLRNLDAQIITFDFDNHSDPAIIGHGIDLLNKGEKVLVMINQLSKGSTASILKFVDSLTRNKSKSILVLFNGDDVHLNQMLNILAPGQLIKDADIDGQKNIAKNFFGIR